MMATLSSKEVEANAELFRVIGHEARLRLLLLLAGGEHGVSELEGVSGIGQPGLSQQLAILRKAQLVTTRRVGKQVYYRVDATAMTGIAGLLAGLADAAAATVLRPRPSGDEPPLKVASSAASFARML